MNENLKWIAAAVAVVGLSVGAVVYFSRGHEKAPVEKPVAVTPPPEAAPAEPPIKHPLPAPDTDQALPPLDESAKPLQGALEDLAGKQAVERYLVPEDLIRHIVVTIDNLPNEKVAERLRPLKPVPGAFVAGGTEDARVLDPANYDRYKPLVQLLRSTDTQRLVDIYTRYYPLFQEAYENLGHPPQYFNDRLIEVIDHLLAAPELQGPIALTQPSVQYEYADAALESLSAGQKILVRMGRENAGVVKAKLRELRQRLVAQRPG
ncbi:MAG TPA: DUF3014 domain-containing protein [Steroidobacteraceae bacterium]|nr:DUF3014 domain-containing protein [Steroidobacteraceae bacterium]